jgi:excinuclease UvrABC nuclease subunit
MDELALIDKIFGEGTKMVDKLRAAGFDSLEKISQADPARLAQSLKVTKGEAREIVQMTINLLSERDDPLSIISGVGETTSEKLQEAGFRTIESVSLAEPEEISEKCQIPISISKRIVTAAREIIQEKSFEGEAETPEEEARVIAFRRRLARLIVKELFD